MVYVDEKKFQKAFIEEATELLELLNEKLLALEKYPEDSEIINEIFRITHSLKSESSLVGFLKISELSHKMEDIFEKIRTGDLLVDTKIINSLFVSYDKIMELMSAVQNNEDESNFDIKKEVALLDEILAAWQTKSESSKIKDEIVKNVSKDIKSIELEFSDIEQGQIEDGLEKGDSFFKIGITIDKTCEMKYPRAYLVYNNFVSAGNVIKTLPDVLSVTDEEKYEYFEIYLISGKEEDELKKYSDIDQVDDVSIQKISLRALKDKGMDLSNVPGYTDMLVTPEEIEEGEKIEKEWKREFEKTKKKNGLDTSFDENIKDEIKKKISKDKAESLNKLSSRAIKKQTIRVDTDRLDVLMNLVGELIINHSRFMQIKSGITDVASVQLLRAEIEDAINELERISDQMQLGMMHVRMVPIGTVFSKFPRMVRDLSNSLQKNVNLIIEGEGTEIDRAIIELITEPLTHLIRNAVDHGIESPEKRERKGKPREGTVILKAYQQGSNIYIEIIDDGKGISLEKIKEKALEKDLVTLQWINEMGDEEIINLIFEPGFSTKETITGISGRGVGMDVVKNQIQKLRGNINIETSYGFGTKITIVLPLTLTIVEALLVNVEKSIFAIPVNIIEETIKIRTDEIKDFDEYKVYDLRDETIAVLFLDEVLAINRKEEQDTEVFIVVVMYERRKIGIIVDELIGNQDIVIKALDESLKSLEGISGAAVLGDGKIAIILDINSLVRARKKEINKASRQYDFFEGEDRSLDKVYDKLNKSQADLNNIYDSLNNNDNNKIDKVKNFSNKEVLDLKKRLEDEITVLKNKKDELDNIGTLEEIDDEKSESEKKLGLLKKADKIKKELSGNNKK